MNILVMFAILILNWSIDMTDPDAQRMTQYIFVAVHLLIAVALFYIFVGITRRNSQTTIEVKDSYEDKMKTVTETEYDFGKLRDFFTLKLCIPFALCMFISRHFAIYFPLLLQCINNPITLWNTELWQVYVLGKESVGRLSRPWKEEGVLPEWLSSVWKESEKESYAFLGRHNYNNNNNSSNNNISNSSSKIEDKSNSRKRR